MKKRIHKKHNEKSIRNVADSVLKQLRRWQRSWQKRIVL